MSYYKMHRGWMKNPIFQDCPLSEREAWCWIIENAAWEERQHRIGMDIIDLDRGQLCAAMRYIGEAWGWSKSKVCRFLHMLEKAAMISLKSGTTAGHGITVISVCNYEIYQGGRDNEEHQCGTTAGQRRDNGGTTAGQNKEVKEVKEDSILVMEGENIDADAVGRKVLEIMGVANDPTWFGNSGRVHQWIADGCDPELDIYPTVRRLMAKKGNDIPKTLRYFDAAVSRARLDRIEPLQEPPPRKQRTQQPQPQPHPKSAKAAFDRWRAETDTWTGEFDL